MFVICACAKLSHNDVALVNSYSSEAPKLWLNLLNCLRSNFRQMWDNKFHVKTGSTQCQESFFFLVCCGCDTFYIVSVHIQCQISIYTLSLCRGHSWRVRLAKQETLTPPGHLVSSLVCRGPWMSTVVLYNCSCHSDSASVLLYFTFCLKIVYTMRLACRHIIKHD